MDFTVGDPGVTRLIFSDDLTAVYEGTRTLKAGMNCITIQMGGWEGGVQRDAWMANAMSHVGIHWQRLRSIVVPGTGGPPLISFLSLKPCL